MIGSVWLCPTGGVYYVMHFGGHGVVLSGHKNRSISKEELLANWEPVVFEAGSTWKHKKNGTLYEIVLVANRYSERGDYELTINYKEGEQVYACAAASFYRRMEKYD